MTFGMTLGERVKITTSASLFYVATDYEIETNMKVAASNINIKAYEQFS